MTYLYDLLDLEELSKMMDEGRISKQVHPSLPLYIYNYTAKAQYVNAWTEPERICRGLIVEAVTNKIIARGPSKFFNYGQPGSPEASLDSQVTVTRKEDGSLGIGWTYEGEFGIATRGSFLSDQAQHATAKMSNDEKADIRWAAERDYTRLWEIVYPDNRIVLDYNGADKLIPLGTVSNETGLITYRPRSITFDNHTSQIKAGNDMLLSEALALPIPDDEEGYVLDIKNDFGMVTSHVKLKGEAYKLLHGLLTNTNARRIWVQLAARDCHDLVHELAEKRKKDVSKTWATFLGWDPVDFERVDVTKSIEETFLTNVPDEFYDWVTKKIDSINDTVLDHIAQSIALAGQISLIDDKKKRFELVKDHVMCTEILRLAESRDTSPVVLKAWQLAQPAGDDTPFRTQED
jgi:RNA ligase